MIYAHDHKCEECGAPATRASRNLRTTAKPGDTWATYERIGPIRAWCDEHERPSIVIDMLTGLFCACGKPAVYEAHFHEYAPQDVIAGRRLAQHLFCADCVRVPEVVD